MSLDQEQRTDNMTFFLDGISWLSLVMDLALLIGVAVYQVGLCYFCDLMQIFFFAVRCSTFCVVENIRFIL
jgi:hypothetical protein